MNHLVILTVDPCDTYFEVTFLYPIIVVDYTLGSGVHLDSLNRGPSTFDPPQCDSIFDDNYYGADISTNAQCTDSLIADPSLVQFGYYWNSDNELVIDYTDPIYDNTSHIYYNCIEIRKSTDPSFFTLVSIQIIVNLGNVAASGCTTTSFDTPTWPTSPYTVPY